MRSWARRTDPTWLLVPLFGALAILYGVLTPPWETPDELGHYEYVRHLLTTRTLVRQSVESPNLGHHPPLYYLIASAFAWPADLGEQATAPRFNPMYIAAGNGGDDPNVAFHTTALTFPWTGHALALHLARLASALIGMATMALVVATARVAFTSTAVAALAGGLLAFDPQFDFITGSISNDTLAAFAGSAAFLLTLLALREPTRWLGWVRVGFALAVGVLAKSSLVATCLAVGVVVLIVAWRARAPMLVLRAAVALGAPFVLGTGWWFVRNQALYGDPLGYGVYRKAWWPSLRTAPLTPTDLVDFASLQFRSFWAYFGWLTVPGPSWIHVGAGALCVAALVGLARIAQGQRQDLLRPDGARALRVALLFAAVQEAYMLLVILDCNASCYQGRYLFPVVAPIAILLAAGIAALVPRLWLTGSALVLLAATLATAVYVPFGVILPAYKLPMEKWQVGLLRSIPPTIVGEDFELLGYEARAQPGGRVDVTLYWRALRAPDFDYSAFVHVIDGADRLVAQKDHAPGAPWGFPPQSWSQGDAVADRHDVDVGGLTPGAYRVRVGLYNWATGEQLPIRINGVPAGSWLILPQPVELAGR